MPKVNLDALIPREDFEATGETKYTSILGDKYPISSLMGNLMYPFIRKPDF